MSTDEDIRSEVLRAEAIRTFSELANDASRIQGKLETLMLELNFIIHRDRHPISLPDWVWKARWLRWLA